MTFTFEDFFIGLAISAGLAIIIFTYQQIKMRYDAKNAKPEIKRDWNNEKLDGSDIFEDEIDSNMGFKDTKDNKTNKGV